MTCTEMRQSLEADYPLIAPKVADIGKQWRKQVLRSNRTRRMTRTWRITCAKSRQEFLLVFIWDPDIRRLDFFVLFAIMRDFNHIYYINDAKHDTSADIVTGYTDHFFRRYAERTGMPPATTIDQAIAAYYRGYTQPVLLYWDEDATDGHAHHSVYAEQQGIKLADVDIDKWIIYRTFVSLDMLKPTQRKAYRNVMELMEQSNERIKQCERRYQHCDEFLSRNNETAMDIINEARDIYAQYFES